MVQCSLKLDQFIGKGKARILSSVFQVPRYQRNISLYCYSTHTLSKCLISVCVCGTGPVALDMMTVLLTGVSQSMEKASGNRSLGSVGIMMGEKAYDFRYTKPDIWSSFPTALELLIPIAVISSLMTEIPLKYPV